MFQSDVVNSNGEYMGHVRDIGIDPETGAVSYVVLSCDGVVGMSDQWFAIPTQALRPSTRAGQLVLDLPEDLFKGAGWSDRGRCPDLERQEIVEIYSYYGFRPYWERMRRPQPALAAV